MSSTDERPGIVLRGASRPAWFGDLRAKIEAYRKVDEDQRLRVRVPARLYDALHAQVGAGVEDRMFFMGCLLVRDMTTAQAYIEKDALGRGEP